MMEINIKLFEIRVLRVVCVISLPTSTGFYFIFFSHKSCRNIQKPQKKKKKVLGQKYASIILSFLALVCIILPQRSLATNFHGEKKCLLVFPCLNCLCSCL